MSFIISGPPSVPTLSCVDLFGDGSGAVNVTVSWSLSGGDSADFYLINITTNAPETPYGTLLNITIASVTQYELTGFQAGYEYNITVRGVNCGSLEGDDSELLTIRPQGMYNSNCCRYACNAIIHRRRKKLEIGGNMTTCILKHAAAKGI